MSMLKIVASFRSVSFSLELDGVPFQSRLCPLSPKHSIPHSASFKYAFDTCGGGG